ncbi:MAG: hypothetical protein AAFV69_06365 [Pseudomonadota bacterium]
MLDQIDPSVLAAATGGVGGLLGGNVLGSFFRKSGVGAGSSTIVGVAAGAVASYFLGPTYGPMVGGLVGGGDIGSILGNLAMGVGGGAGGSLVWGLLRSMMGGRG